MTDEQLARIEERYLETPDGGARRLVAEVRRLRAEVLRHEADHLALVLQVDRATAVADFLKAALTNLIFKTPGRSKADDGLEAQIRDALVDYNALRGIKP